MLDVRRLSVLREVARHGSFSRAADNLGYTQPAVSRQIALLERETGATLVDRLPGGVRLTDAGELLVGHAEAVLGRLEDAESELNELLGMQSGKLRISTLTSAAATIMPLAISDFRKRLPGVELSVSMVDPAGVLPLLRTGELDLALCNDPELGDDGDIEIIHLFDEPMLLALPRDHPLAGSQSLQLTDLAADKWMLGTTHSCPDAGRFIRACHKEGFEPKIAFHNDDYTAILGFVAGGVGVAPVPEMVARNAPRSVSICPLEHEPLARSIVVALPVGYRPKPAEAMIEILRRVSERWTRQQRIRLAAA